LTAVRYFHKFGNVDPDNAYEGRSQAMKRFHVHVAVSDLEQSIRFYSTVFATPPSVHKPDYAKWMLDDPRINFAISQRSGKLGVNHLGLQVDSGAELEDIHGRLDAAGGDVVAEENVSCCYAKSDKYWITDPQGVAWESFRSLDTVPYFGAADVATASPVDRAASCGAATGAAGSSCCGPSVVAATSAQSG
jgi:catechol 2,3-dioxygenase-like lactoylglutathione lyase family enzyme